jgi:hypothetical protein
MADEHVGRWKMLTNTKNLGDFRHGCEHSTINWLLYLAVGGVMAAVATKSGEQIRCQIGRVIITWN